MLDWGTVPAVGSAVIALWALVEARLARRRQKADDRQSHARQVVVSPSHITDIDEATCRVEAQVTNYGGYPIRDVFLIVHSKVIAEPVHEAARVLLPGHTLMLQTIAQRLPDPFPLPARDPLWANASFTDVDGYKWQRWANGKIRPPISLQAPHVLKPVLRISLIGRLFKRWRSRSGRPPVREALPRV